MKIITKKQLEEKANRTKGNYWVRSWRSRWDYLQIVAAELHDINPSTVLELGAYKINLTSISDNLDQKVDFIDPDNLGNKQYIHQAQETPWAIKDKQYDVVICLQMFEHLSGDQRKVFNEIRRISRRAIISFPYKWDEPDDFIHHDIDDDDINLWTCNQPTYKTVTVGGGKKSKRQIRFYEFKW